MLPNAARSSGVRSVIAICAVMFGPVELGKPPDPSIIEAYPRPDWYFLWYFALVAVLGGIAGGFLRWYKQVRRRAEEIPVYFALGALTGVISYYVLSALLGKLVVLQNVGLETKIGEAIVWGVIGGVLGPHLLADRITKLVSKEP